MNNQQFISSYVALHEADRDRMNLNKMSVCSDVDIQRCHDISKSKFLQCIEQQKIHHLDDRDVISIGCNEVNSLFEVFWPWPTTINICNTITGYDCRLATEPANVESHIMPRSCAITFWCAMLDDVGIFCIWWLSNWGAWNIMRVFPWPHKISDNLAEGKSDSRNHWSSFLCPGYAYIDSQVQKMHLHVIWQTYRWHLNRLCTQNSTGNITVMGITPLSKRDVLSFLPSYGILT
jgi:hypothetical protein